MAFVIEKYTDIFRGGGGGVLGVDFLENLPWGEKFLGGWVTFPGEMSVGGFAKLLYEILYNCLTFSLPNFLCGDIPGELSGAIFRVFWFPNNNFHGRRHFWIDQETG